MNETKKVESSAQDLAGTKVYQLFRDKNRANAVNNCHSEYINIL